MPEKSPTEILRKEHDIVLGILDRLEKNIEAKDAGNAGKTINSLEKEFSRHSLKKEEKALFPEMEKFMPRDGGPTGMMIMEHKDLVGSIKEFKKAVGAKDMESAERSGSHIISLLRQHINKENTILFMMAEMHLDDKQKKEILKKFRSFDSAGGS